MEMNLGDRFDFFLAKRKNEGNFRTLKTTANLIDFSSNDYLGLTRSAWLQQKIHDEISKMPFLSKGATGSRLLTGNNTQVADVEQQIADFHNAESALLFNSGFDANMGLISTVSREGDVILYDELVHASIHTGMKLSAASKISFKHNDLADLAEKLPKEIKGQCFIVVESLYSMEGDFAPLKQLSIFCEENNIYLIVDEAHALGVFGEQGRGLANETGIENNVFARIYTYGKALGAHGAAVVGSEKLKTYLVNFCKPFIYSTALDLHSVLAIKNGYKFLQINDKQRIKLINLNYYLNESISANQTPIAMVGQGPIFGIYCSNNQKAKHLSSYLIENGIDIRPILYPTVPLGKERLRFILHSYNTKAEIDYFLDKLNIYINKISP